jgi:hypothetical protein
MRQLIWPFLAPLSVTPLGCALALQRDPSRMIAASTPRFVILLPESPAL